MNKNARNLTLWFVLLIILAFAAYFQFTNMGSRAAEDSLTFSDFLTVVETSPNSIESVEIGHEVIKVQFVADERVEEISWLPSEAVRLEERLEAQDVDWGYKAARKYQWLTMLAGSVLPLLFFIGLIFFMSRQMQGTGNRAMSFGKSRAKVYSTTTPKVTFRDVAGCEEAKDALQEVIEFLQEPKKFQRLGGRIPKGVMLVGPPGTGKTLLARAVAGEAGVPFFSISGSDFVEMFVGVGAARVRDLFEQGKKNAPCIVFIDELDAVGRHRGAGIGGGHDEREQTLNQLLVDMDGFDTSGGVIVVAATNRPDVLDPALLRAGRFDRQVMVDLPDVRGREAILEVHARDKPLAEEANLERLARGTPGFSGADLENIINEAALLAAKSGLEKIPMQCFEDAKDRVMMGPERRSLVISDRERRNTAYHEAGHALVAHYHPDMDPNYKVSIIPRGRALGVTVSLPLEDRHNHTRDQLMARISHALGGRIAEELIFGEQTTGATNDFVQATEMARKMVCEFGMSEKMGPLAFGRGNEQIFLGREISRHKDFSEQTAIMIDEEVRKVVETAWACASDIIRGHSDQLNLLAEGLLDKETLDTDDIEGVLGPRPHALNDSDDRDGDADAAPQVEA
ncbi:ATP-dependent metallopeptidase FtsH/Yme1/Tma family protein [Candidatus Poribacteria bacterium]|nr:ATP-dependent metallopeptidase FtsH/Yme1/Tma family protein [Candidatus Poribacteria bacterium]MBT5533641.1 ATP-dependent metallopeptidase FtsH/Yme1/Tma family protein [Candidatus Poribacteria bacterium]MBT7097609.1 ATP-dependent metallopeptidase FtsH/Yme1/Tma family protein [Candidatus Poribacteria bacterium]MBT7804183.1 ATP-dependent metallopeptidase FtsH/Yme1/Tma family protein [Candidatus Poribacteria bacterium]